MEQFATYYCATCGEKNEVFVDADGGGVQQFTEDCSVCCRPNVLRIRISEDGITIESEFEG